MDYEEIMTYIKKRQFETTDPYEYTILMKLEFIVLRAQEEENGVL